tara:strand:- start:11819 stop:11953 length:135 start_codon:yes stop_codon:yes gene_type:complete
MKNIIGIWVSIFVVTILLAIVGLNLAAFSTPMNDATNFLESIKK